MAVKVDVDEGGELGRTALLNACKRGDCEIVTMLLEKGADITIPAKHGDTPIMEATVSHSTNVLKLLLDYLLSSWGRRRSSAAGGGKREEEEEEQEEQEEERVRGINNALSARQWQGQTALIRSMLSPGNGEEAALLLQAGASPFFASNWGSLPVLHAEIAHKPVLQRRFEEAMREPERVWRLAQARAVLDGCSASFARRVGRRGGGGRWDGGQR
jgi:ankyrin repeat protein